MRESENLNQFVVVLSILFWLILSGVFATDFFIDIFYLLFFVVADSAFACRFKSIGIASLHCCCFRCRCGGFAAGRIRRRFWCWWCWLGRFRGIFEYGFFWIDHHHCFVSAERQVVVIDLFISSSRFLSPIRKERKESKCSRTVFFNHFYWHVQEFTRYFSYTHRFLR